MMIPDRSYQSHEIFDELESYIEFYKHLAESVFGSVSLGTKAICNIDSYVFSSIQGTVSSIRAILRDGRINDAYALLRKYYDAAIINIYTNLYLQDHFSIENFVVKKIDNWRTGRDQLPEYREMSQYIRSSERVAPITAIVFGDDRYKRLRGRCNDHMHFNFYRNVLLNDNEIAMPDRRQALDVLSTDVRDILILHVAYLFFVNEHYMMSSDYVDSLECGMLPEPDSQYWVAPFIQGMIDKTVAKYRSDILEKIKEHTSMQLA